VGARGFDLAGMDKSVKPGDDFYRHAVGSYVDRVAIPSDLSSWDSLTELALKAEEDVREVVEKAADAKPARGTIEQKVADAYASYLDTARIEARGLAPFEADLASFTRLETHEDVAAAIGRPGLPSNTPLAIFPTVDAKDPGRYALAVTQSGLGLPSRDFYLSDNPAFVAIRAKYRDYVEQMLALAKYPGAAESATAVAAVEARIAAAQWPIEKARNKDLTYNPKSLAELEAFAPGFPWRSALEGAGLTGRDRLVVKEQEAVRDLARTFGETPVATWRAYLTFHYLNAQADIMPAAFDDAQFAFSGKVLSGIGQKRERWKRAVGEISGPYGAGPLGEAVGRLYVAEHFPPEAKAAILGLVKNLLAAYQKRITSLPWMSPETRAAAIRKGQPGRRAPERPAVLDLARPVPGRDRDPERMDARGGLRPEAPGGPGEAVSEDELDVRVVGHDGVPHGPVPVAAGLEPWRVLHGAGIDPGLLAHARPLAPDDLAPPPRPNTC
jgi:predicted metalloendopeptidase